jgi:hypothetical protein
MSQKPCSLFSYARIYSATNTPCLTAGFTQSERSTITLLVDRVPAMDGKNAGTKDADGKGSITLVNILGRDMPGELLGSKGTLWIELVVSGERLGIRQVLELIRIGTAITIATVDNRTSAPFPLAKFPLDPD